MNKLDPIYAGQSQNLMDMFDRLQTRMKYRALSTAGLAIGSASKAKVLIASTVSYLHNGIFKSKTTAEVAFTATTHDIPSSLTDIKERCYLLSLAADGTPTITPGAIATGAGKALLPEIPADKTPIGFVRIAVAAGEPTAFFDATTTDLDATHLTVAYTNLGWVSERFDATQ